jgi:hypothetical protein
MAGIEGEIGAGMDLRPSVRETSPEMKAVDDQQ